MNAMNAFSCGHLSNNSKSHTVLISLLLCSWPMLNTVETSIMDVIQGFAFEYCAIELIKESRVMVRVINKALLCTNVCLN